MSKPPLMRMPDKRRSSWADRLKENLVPGWPIAPGAVSVNDPVETLISTLNQMVAFFTWVVKKGFPRGLKTH